jgi:serine/threonine protein kinase
VNPSRWREINDLFHVVLDQPADARQTILAETEHRDPELAREVRSLLDTHERSGAFLNEPAWGVAADLLLDQSSLVGRQLGAYRVVEEIGRGGMGVVYAAEDLRLGRKVALKALPPEFTRDALRRARLTREARAAAALSHPSIATVFALEEIDGELYIVSELVRGRTLRDELQDGALPRQRLLHTLIDVAAALEAAHTLGIVHRDLKPENIVRRADGQIKVLDFGLARWEDAPDARSTTRLTEAGVALGTPGYMAPEQLLGAPTDARSDIFSFGVLAWELAAGEHPFGSDPGTVVARMTALTEGRAATPGRPLPLPGLERIARRCMHGVASERYPSASLLLSDLRALETGATIVGDPLSTTGGGAPPRLFWWRVHQSTIAALVAASPILVWAARRSIWGGKWVFFAVLGVATIAVTLRLNLLFTASVHPSMLPAHQARLFRWIAAAEGVLAALLLLSALMLGGASDSPGPASEAAAAALLAIAVIIAASLALIEPATTLAEGIRQEKH